MVTAPSSAVQHGPNGLYVYQVKADNTVGLQPVTVAREEAGQVGGSTGLSEGMAVVTAGQSRLQSGARVAVRDDATPATAAAAQAKTGS